MEKIVDLIRSLLGADRGAWCRAETQHDLLAVSERRSDGLGDAVSRPVTSVVFGNALADVGYVAEALRGADASAADSSRTAVMIRAFSDVSSLQETLRTLARSEARTLLVVDTRSRWDVT